MTNPLTDTELECIKWIADGKTSEETAEILGRSKHAVNRLLERSRLKTGAATSASLAVMAVRKGWLQ